MATKADFTEPEWDMLRKGISGAGMLVSLSDRDFTDTFGEMGALGKYLAGQQVASPSALVRDLTHGRIGGFGLTASPDKVLAETMQALTGSIALLGQKAPDEVEAYRGLVLGLADVVAQAKGGVTPVETSMVDQIRGAVGASS